MTELQQPLGGMQEINLTSERWRVLELEEAVNSHSRFQAGLHVTITARAREAVPMTLPSSNPFVRPSLSRG